MQRGLRGVPVLARLVSGDSAKSHFLIISMVEVLPSQRKVSAQLMMNIATKYPTDATVLQAIMHILASMLHEKGLSQLHTLTHRLRRRDRRAKSEQLSRRFLLRVADRLHHHPQQRALRTARPRR